ncbi:hypothetical protein CRENBAI_009648 [Crenichthys baileyi]|uniref:Uncharacterized protein n=1 Tax=Crenichthys baileyi TaxID=28760 RepID=A0AAV9S1U9_9TELE
MTPPNPKALVVVLWSGHREVYGTNRAPSPRCPLAWHRIATTTRPAEQQNKPHTNTEAANNHTQPKMARNPNTNTSQGNIGRAPLHRQTNRKCQHQPGSQSDHVTHNLAHYSAKGKDAGPANPRVPQKGHSPHRKEATPPPRQNHRHPGQPSKNHTPHILPYILRDTVKTINPACPPPQHAIQQRTEHSKKPLKQKPCTKPTSHKCVPTSLPKIKSPAKVTPAKRRPTTSIPKHTSTTIPTEKLRPLHPENNASQHTCPNHADPSSKQN